MNATHRTRPTVLCLQPERCTHRPRVHRWPGRPRSLTNLMRLATSPDSLFPGAISLASGECYGGGSWGTASMQTEHLSCPWISDCALLIKPHRGGGSSPEICLVLPKPFKSMALGLEVSQARDTRARTHKFSTMTQQGFPPKHASSPDQNITVPSHCYYFLTTQKPDARFLLTPHLSPVTVRQVPFVKCHI